MNAKERTEVIADELKCILRSLGLDVTIEYRARATGSKARLDVVGTLDPIGLVFIFEIDSEPDGVDHNIIKNWRRVLESYQEVPLRFVEVTHGKAIAPSGQHAATDWKENSIFEEVFSIVPIVKPSGTDVELRAKVREEINGILGPYVTYSSQNDYNSSTVRQLQRPYQPLLLHGSAMFATEHIAKTAAFVWHRAGINQICRDQKTLAARIAVAAARTMELTGRKQRGLQMVDWIRTNAMSYLSEEDQKYLREVEIMLGFRGYGAPEIFDILTPGSQRFQWRIPIALAVREDFTEAREMLRDYDGPAENTALATAIIAILQKEWDEARVALGNMSGIMYQQCTDGKYAPESGQPIGTPVGYFQDALGASLLEAIICEQGLGDGSGSAWKLPMDLFAKTEIGLNASCLREVSVAIPKDILRKLSASRPHRTATIKHALNRNDALGVLIGKLHTLAHFGKSAS